MHILRRWHYNYFLSTLYRKLMHILRRWHYKYLKFESDIKVCLLVHWYLKLTVIFNCKRQPYFFYRVFRSKTGYWLGVCHGWFHLQGLTGGVKNASRVRITKLKSLTHCGIRTRDLPFTKRARYHWATKADVSRADKCSPGFTYAIFRNLPVARVRCSKIICRFFFVIWYLYRFAVYQLRSLLTVKSLQNVIHEKVFCYIYQVLQVN